MNILIVKLNATGDVVRTTSLLRALRGDVTWLTATVNTGLIAAGEHLRCLPWSQRAEVANEAYDLVISLEDEPEVAQFVQDLSASRVFGAHLDRSGQITYSEDASPWFDMSLISRFGREHADALKLANRRSYQEIVFEAMGLEFQSHPYLLAEPTLTGLAGDVAIAPVAGPVWPMKGWAYYAELEQALQARGLTVNRLPKRATLREHLGDIVGHKCLVGGDSLPMHLALGSGVRCVTLFNCTSPWEIYDYGLQTKLVSPLLERFFYKRTFDHAATTAISLESVLDATLAQVGEAEGAPAEMSCPLETSAKRNGKSF